MANGVAATKVGDFVDQYLLGDRISADFVQQTPIRSGWCYHPKRAAGIQGTRHHATRSGIGANVEKGTSGGEILLLAGSDSWVLPFLTQKDILVRPTSKTHLALDLAANLAANRPTAVLALNRSDFRHIEFPLRLLENFPSESGTTLYGLNGSDAGVPRVAWDAGHYDDGWTSPQAVLTVENWPSNVISLEFWNPTPLIRTVEFSSLAEPNPKQVELVPGARHSIPIRVALADYINIRVTPSYNTGNPSDPRQLGVRLSIMQPDSPP